MIHRRREAWLSIALLPALLAAPAGALAPVSLAAPTAIVVQARPALWVVQDADTTIYLFGTFHALDGQAAWFDRDVRAAFDASDALVLETLVPDSPAAIRAALGPLLDTARPPEAVRQANAATRAAGMSAQHGADQVLRRAAVAAGKPVEGLESFAFQIAMYRQISVARPAAAPLASPVATPSATVTEQGAALVRLMQGYWAQGDAEGFAAIIGALRTQSPATYKTMFADRNADWAGWIGKRLETPGTVFIAVGTGHLVGKDSVQVRLAERGIRSLRVS